MKAFRLTIAFLFVALITAIAIIEPDKTLENNNNCVRWINGECVESKLIPCTTDIECETLNGGEY